MHFRQNERYQKSVSGRAAMDYHEHPVSAFFRSSVLIQASFRSSVMEIVIEMGCTGFQFDLEFLDLTGVEDQERKKVLGYLYSQDGVKLPRKYHTERLYNSEF